MKRAKWGSASTERDKVKSPTPATINPCCCGAHCGTHSRNACLPHRRMSQWSRTAHLRESVPIKRENVPREGYSAIDRQSGRNQPTLIRGPPAKHCSPLVVVGLAKGGKQCMGSTMRMEQQGRRANKLYDPLTIPR